MGTSAGKLGGIATCASSSPEARARGVPAGVPETRAGELALPLGCEQAEVRTKATMRRARSTAGMSTRDQSWTDHAASGAARASHRFPAQEHLLDGEIELGAFERAVPLPRPHVLGRDPRLAAGVDDDQVRVETGRDGAFAFLKPDQPRRRFAHPPRREPHVAEVLGQLEAAEIQRLHPGAAGGHLLEAARLLLVRVWRVVGTDDADRPSLETADQSVAVGGRAN